MPADILEAAQPTFGTAGYAYSPSMEDKSVAEVIALVRRYYLPQLTLHFSRLLDIINQAYEVAQPYAVRIRDYGRLAKYIAHNLIGAFSPYPGE